MHMMTLDDVYTWLNTQPGDREFIPARTSECVLGAYLTDKYPNTFVSVGINKFKVGATTRTHTEEMRRLVCEFDLTAPLIDHWTTPRVIEFMHTLPGFGKCTCGGCFGVCEENSND